MAIITATGNINWSAIPFDPVNFEATIVAFNNAMVPPMNEFFAKHYTITGGFPPDQLLLRLASGKLVSMSGSTLDTTPIVNDVVVNDFLNGRILGMGGVIDRSGPNDTVTDFTYQTLSSAVTYTGSFILSPAGVFQGGTLSSISLFRSNGFTTDISGSLTVASNGNISGTITDLGISSVDGDITVSGLSLPFDSTLTSIVNAGQLFSLAATSGNDSITIGGTSSVTLNGGDGNDTITSGTGNDTLNGGAGNDTLNGGLGNDTYIYDGTADSFVEGVGAGTDRVLASASYTLPAASANIENVTLTGTGAINATGNDGANVLIGNAGDNVLDGATANDTQDGGVGNDTLLGGLGVDSLVGGVGNDSLVGGAGVDTVNGGAGNDRVTIDVTDGNVDVADGGALESDTLVLAGVVGGDGIVVVNLASTTDQVSKIGNVSSETLVQKNFENVDGLGLDSALNATGSAGANLIAGSNGADTLVGGLGNDTLIGHGAADILTGGAGADMHFGGAGDDIVIVASAADYLGDSINGGAGFDTLRFTSGVAATLALNANFAQLEQVWIADATGDFSGTAPINVNASLAPVGLAITGNDGANVITGTAFADNLNGAGGNDVFLISAGSHHTADELIDGHLGDKNVIRFTSAVAGTLMLSTEIYNIHEVEASDAASGNLGTAALNIDASNAQGLPGVFTLTGNNGANALTGTVNADIINGNAGSDTLVGGAGVDTVNGGAGNDRVTMLVTAGNVDVADGGALESDTLVLSGAADGDGVVMVDLSSTLDQVTRIGTANPESLVQKNFENLDASGVTGSVNVTGSGAANLISGSSGNDTLLGGALNDTLVGGAGIDGMSGGDGNDVFLIAHSTDHLGSETANGGLGIDVLRFTSTSDADGLQLTSNVAVEQVVIGNAAGLTTGMTALNVNATNAANALTIIGNNGANAIIGTGFGDTMIGNSGDDSLNGGAGDDRVSGDAGNDTLVGGNGKDTLLGGAGNDFYDNVIPGAGNTVVSETLAGPAGGTDTVRTNYDYTLGANVENLILLGGEGQHGTGNTLNNVLTGSGLSDTLVGGAGNDTLNGGASSDSLNGGTGNDTIVVSVQDGATTPAGVDTADGGALGSDTLVVVGVAGGNGDVSIQLGSTTDQIGSIGETGNPIAQINFEHVDGSGLGAGTFLLAEGSAGANLLIGSSNNDSLYGLGGNDTLRGGAGTDNLQGGSENDLFLIGAGEYDITEAIDGGAGIGDVIRFTSTVPGALALGGSVINVERIEIANAAGSILGITALDVNALASGLTQGLTILGNNGTNLITGSSGSDTISGNGGDDTLDGSGGTDRLMGGVGNDTYILSFGSNDLVIEVAGAGTDVVNLGRDDYTVPVNVENANMSIAASGTLRGNESANVLVFSSSGAGSGWVLGMGGNDVLTSTSSGTDSLVGGDGNDTLTGGAGEDTILGGLGNDLVIMQASAGNRDVANGGVNLGDSDTLALTGDAGGIVEVNLAAGAGDQLTVINGATESLLQNNFENFDGSGLLNPVNVTGSAGANVISGVSGQVDTMAGGLGNDTYRIQSGDQVTEGLNQGIDHVIFTLMLADYTLADNVEQLTILTWEGGTATGNGLNNIIRDDSGQNVALSGGIGADSLVGGSGNNTLIGGMGTDTLVGGAGNDTYRLNTGANVGDAADRIVEGLNQGTDTVEVQFITTYTLPVNIENGLLANLGDVLGTLRGNTLDNLLQGSAEGAGTFVLDGGAGNDTLVGSLNGDTLLGGLGNDTIQLATVAQFASGEFIDGGAGTDALQVTGTGQTLDLTTIGNSRILGIEIVDITGSGNNTLTLSVGDLLDLSVTTNILRVDGNAGDVVNSAGQAWVLDAGGPIAIGPNQYNSYASGVATLLIDTDITQTNVT